MLIRNARLLRNVTEYKNVYVNKDLTCIEIEEEKAPRKLKKEKKEELTFEDGDFKYEIMNNGIELYWGIRFGKVCRIDRSTKRAI